MASACVNNVGVTPGKFSSYAWLSPARVSFGKGKAAAAESDLENDAVDFEFCFDYIPVDMLPAADELICDGKLMLQVNKQPVVAEKEAELRLPEMVKTRRITEVLSSSSGSSGGDPFLFSPKAPRCASRWKEILGLKKLHQSNNTPREKSNKSLKHLLNRNSKSSSDSAAGLNHNLNLNLPLLDCESQSMSSRLSLSSSSSGLGLEDFPRLSLDAEKQPSINPISLLKSNPNPPSRMRLVKPRPAENAGSRQMRRTATDQSQTNTGAGAALGITVDSPRMNSSGRIVFQSLERSSSSPGSFNGGPRLKHGGMERSYSANVRVSPVLNVPVCSLSKSGSVFGFGQLFSSQQKKDSNGRSY